MGDRRAGPWRQGRRDGAQHRIAGRPGRASTATALLPIRLDVTDRDADFAAVKQAHDHFGRLDIVVNNAGYGQFGFVEELSEQEARDQIETNVFGALWITQAALPYLREQRSGHIIQVSSIGGITAFPIVGIYHASKWALEGFSQALAQEVAPFGVHVTLIEPGGFSTDWAGSSARHAEPLPAYDEVHAATEAERSRRWSAARRPQRVGGRAAEGGRRASSRRCGCSSALRRCIRRRPTTRSRLRNVGAVAAGRRAGAGLGKRHSPCA